MGNLSADAAENRYLWDSPDEDSTFELGRAIGGLAQAGDLIALTGELGSGKTVLAKGVAAGLGVEGRVVSPTFTLIREYHGRLPLYHFDLYRLENPAEIEGLGYEEYFFGFGITLIEWADRADAYLPRNYLEIHFDHLDRGRRLELTAYGERYEKLLKDIKACLRWE